MVTFLYMNLILVVKRRKKKVTFSSYLTECMIPATPKWLSSIQSFSERSAVGLITESDSLLNLTFSQSPVALRAKQLTKSFQIIQISFLPLIVFC